MKKLFEDDPLAEDWDKYGRVYRPATEVLGSSSMAEMIFLGSEKLHHDGYRKLCKRKKCKKKFAPKIHNQKFCTRECRDLARYEKEKEEYEQTL